MSEKKLGRFGFHTNPLTDYEMAVRSLDGMYADMKVGITSPAQVRDQLARLLDFNVITERGVEARNKVKGIAALFEKDHPNVELKSTNEQRMLKLLRATYESIRVVDDYPKGNTAQTIRRARVRLEKSGFIKVQHE